MSECLRRSMAAITAALCLASAAGAAESTKDIVLDRITAPAATGRSAAVAGSDAMAVSVLLESPDGTLTPRGTDKPFRTGDRFRVKVLASRDAHIALYNTNPRGVLGEKPVWEGNVKIGQELITPRLRLEGSSGVDYLHIVLQPAKEEGVFAWLGAWLSRTKDAVKDGASAGSAKDISLDVQNTASATYLINGRGQGLVTTMRIVHR